MEFAFSNHCCSVLMTIFCFPSTFINENPKEDLHLLQHVFTYVISSLYRHQLTDIDFVLWLITQCYHLFCCPNCSNFDHSELCQVDSQVFLTYLSLFLSAFLFSGIRQFRFTWNSCCSSSRISNFSKSLDSFYRRIVFGTDGSGYQVCFLLLECHFFQALSTDR